MTSALYQKIKASVDAIRAKGVESPEVGIILGSGLGAISSRIKDPIVVQFSEIPNFFQSTVEGYLGQLIYGKLHGVPVVALLGRSHYYEGRSMEETVFPTRVLCALGINSLILTNAAGAINPAFQPGDFMLIQDHINLMGINPLRGPDLAELGPRFTDLTEAYNRALMKVVEEVARKNGITLHRGVYVASLGPTYETPAEVKMLQILGVDAVGMSVVPEAIAANHLGVRVMGLSLITNKAAGISEQKLNYKDMLEVARVQGDRMGFLIEEAVPGITKR